MSLWTWLGGIFHNVKVKISPVIVGVLNVVAGLEDSGVMDGIAKVVDATFKTSLAEDVNTLVKNNVRQQLAVWLGIEDLSADATDDQIKAFDTAVVNAYLSKKAAQSIPGQVAQQLGVQLFDIIKKTVGDAKVSEKSVTAAEIGADIEEAYQDLQADLAAAQAATTTTTAS